MAMRMPARCRDETPTDLTPRRQGQLKGWRLMGIDHFSCDRISDSGH